MQWNGLKVLYPINWIQARIDFDLVIKQTSKIDSGFFLKRFGANRLIGQSNEYDIAFVRLNRYLISNSNWSSPMTNASSSFRTHFKNSPMKLYWSLGQFPSSQFPKPSVHRIENPRSFSVQNWASELQPLFTINLQNAFKWSDSRQNSCKIWKWFYN